MSSLNFAIIGSGAMGLEHIRNIKLIPGCQVVAVADSDGRAQDEARALLDVDAVVIPGYSDLLDKCPARIDAVILATPNYTHIDVLRVIIPWKKHLLVEKPMCTTVGDCVEVQALLAAHMPQTETGMKGRPIFWVGMEYRYMPPIAKLLSVVDGGGVGAVRMVHIREHRFPFLLKVGNWNRFSRFTGGTLVEKCCHFWDLMRRIVAGEGRGGPAHDDDEKTEAEAGSSSSSAAAAAAASRRLGKRRSAVPLRVYASGGMDVNHVDERYAPPSHSGKSATSTATSPAAATEGAAGGGEGSSGSSSSSSSGSWVPDIVDNAFCVVDFEGGERACLDLCMFAEDRQHEQVSVVGSAGKVEAEAPACVVTHHVPQQRASGPTPANPRVPPPSQQYEANTVVESTTVAGALLEAGYHEGATFFELEAFANAVKGGGCAAVGVEDGLWAVAMGVAAERSLREKRAVLVAEVLDEAQGLGVGMGLAEGGAETKKRRKVAS